MIVAEISRPLCQRKIRLPMSSLATCTADLSKKLFPSLDLVRRPYCGRPDDEPRRCASAIREVLIERCWLIRSRRLKWRLRFKWYPDFAWPTISATFQAGGDPCEI